MKRKVDKEAIRAAQREAYLTAWRDSHPGADLPDLRYENGWWHFDPLHVYGIRHRTSKLLEMTRSLEKMAVRK